MNTISENILFSMNAVLPFFSLIIIGYCIVSFGWVKREFFSYGNSYVYHVALPASSFYSLACIKADGNISASLLLFCGASLIVFFVLSFLLTELICKDKSMVGTLVQGSFRLNFILLSVPLAASIGGDSAWQKASVLVLVVLPITNIFSIIALLIRGDNKQKLTLKTVIKGVVTNPVLIGIAAGVPFLVFNIPVPAGIKTTLSYVAGTAMPLGLLSVGAMLSLKDATAKLPPALYTSLLKNLVMPILITIAGYLIGFRTEDLMLIFILSASPTAISSFTMTTAMGGDVALSANIVIITTLVSAPVLAIGIYFMRTLGWI